MRYLLSVNNKILEFNTSKEIYKYLESNMFKDCKNLKVKYEIEIIDNFINNENILLNKKELLN